MSGSLYRDLAVVARAGRITLRRRSLADAPNEYRWQRDPDLARFNGVAPVTSPYSEFLEVLDRELRTVDSSRDGFAIEAGDAQHIGTAVFYNGNHANSSVEIGMFIGEPAYQSGGYGREAAICLVRHIFSTRPFTRIYLHALDWNERARRTFAAIGFEEVGPVIRHHDTLVRMEARREYWLLADLEGHFDRYLH